MFDWLKKSKTGTQSSAMQPLHFKDTDAAFTYACEYLQSELAAGAVLLALVLDAKTVGGAETLNCAA